MSKFRFRPDILEGVPDHLTRDMPQFEDWFMLSAAELKKITDHFVKELEKGLTKEGGNIVGDPITMPQTKSGNFTNVGVSFLTLYSQ